MPCFFILANRLTLHAFAKKRHSSPSRTAPPSSQYRKTFLAICKNAHQIHFGSQCATERVYRYLPAKVELKKSHFGKESLIECALRRPPCQSEFAELREPRTISDNLVNSFHQLNLIFGQHRISDVIFRCILKK